MMKKRSLIALALVAATALGSVQSAFADSGDVRSLVIGAAQTNVNLLGIEDVRLSGVSLSYKAEHTNSPLGMVATLTHTSKSASASAPEISARADLKYTSFTAGPSLRLSKYSTVYAQAGIAKGKGSGSATFDGESYKGKLDDTAPVAGIGLHLQTHRHFFLNAYAEMAGGDLDTETYSIGLGLMF